MADCPFVSVANAIVYELNAASESQAFNRAFESEVIWADREEALEDLKNIHVDVAPIDWSQRMIGRGIWSYTLNYIVGIRKRFEATEQNPNGEISNQEVVDLVNLLGSLSTFFMPKAPSPGQQLTQHPKAQWLPNKDTKTNLFITWEHLEEFQQFTGYFPITFFVGE